MRRSVIAFGVLGSVGAAVLAGATPASAGLFDFLFGSSQPAQPAYTPYQSAPMDIRVRPRRSQRSYERYYDETAQPGKAVPADAPKQIVYVKIDTEKQPDWYLRDKTLRRGDIIVLKTGPVVYEGPEQAQHPPEQFVSLKDSRYVSTGGKRDIMMMVSGIWSAAEAAPAAAVAPAYPAAPRRWRRQATRYHGWPAREAYAR